MLAFIFPAFHSPRNGPLIHDQINSMIKIEKKDQELNSKIPFSFSEKSKDADITVLVDKLDETKGKFLEDFYQQCL